MQKTRISLADFPLYVAVLDPTFAKDTRGLSGDLSDYRIIPCEHGEIGAQSDQMLWCSVNDPNVSKVLLEAGICRAVQSYVGGRTVFHLHRSVLSQVALIVGAKLKKGKQHVTPSPVDFHKAVGTNLCVMDDGKGAFIPCQYGFIRPMCNRTIRFEAAVLNREVLDPLARSLRKLGGCHVHEYRQNPDVAFDAFFPVDLLAKVCKIVGAELTEDGERVQAARRRGITKARQAKTTAV